MSGLYLIFGCVSAAMPACFTLAGPAWEPGASESGFAQADFRGLRKTQARNLKNSVTFNLPVDNRPCSGTRLIQKGN
jgi:hypothetical protein